MIDIQVIDKSKRIKSAMKDVEANIFVSTDEVQAINAVEKNQPSVVLLNYDFCKEQTFEYISLILNISSASKIVIVADELNERNIINCLIAGSKGYQEFKQLDVYVKKIVEVVDAGEAWITRRLVATLLDKLRIKNT